jgi:signal transduction histidine kinase
VGHAALFSVRVDEPAPRAGDFAPSLVALHVFRWAAECIQEGLVVTVQPAESAPPTIIYANPAFIALSGLKPNDWEPYTPDAAPTAPWPPRGNPLWESLEQSHQCDGLFLIDVVMGGQGKRRTLLQLRSEPVCDPSGRVTHRIALVHDVTEHANLQEALRRNERLAGIGLLAAGIAHEINNPTGSALLAAETALAILDSPGAGPQVAACLRNIVTSMDRCGRIVRSLLRYSREEPTERQKCSINDVAKQASELARPYAEQHGTELRLELDPDVPLAPMNPLEIELVLVNLLRNAVEAGGSVVVSVGTGRTDECVRVVVTDKGCGMDQEQLAHVFDPLYTTRRKLGGSGLGMSIAYGIIQGHLGRMDVQSQPGVGTAVIIDLPVAPAAEQAANRPEQSDNPPSV